MTTLTEPLCCDEPMVHNSWTLAYECAAAYFQLVDDKVVTDRPLRSDELATVTDFYRDLHAHWMTTMVTDCCGMPMSLSTDARLQEHAVGCSDTP